MQENRPVQGDFNDSKPDTEESASRCDDDLDLEGYSPAAREAIRRRMKADPEEGPEEEDFERAVKRSSEERKDD